MESLADPTKRANLNSMQITQITTQVLQAMGDLASAQARLVQTQSVAKYPSASPDILSCPAIQKLREE
jgi:uncharacterized protein involved in exopolysaccharide biosynthesis